MPILTFHKDFWELKAQTDCMAKLKIHSTLNALRVDLQEDKDLKLQQKLQFFQFAQILLDQWEFPQLFVEFMGLNQLEAKGFQWKVELELQEKR